MFLQVNTDRLPCLSHFTMLIPFHLQHGVLNFESKTWRNILPEFYCWFSSKRKLCFEFAINKLGYKRILLTLYTAGTPAIFAAYTQTMFLQVNTDRLRCLFHFTMLIPFHLQPGVFKFRKQNME